VREEPVALIEPLLFWAAAVAFFAALGAWR
jgi:hypothetical protein